jgi:hypothetical protein
MQGYDTAQICLNGHVINECAGTMPHHNTPHCSRCGAGTITACARCKTAIRGTYHLPGAVGFFGERSAPVFCHQCGAAYPWTESRLKAARDLANELEKLDAKDRELLSKSLDDIICETPQTPVAAMRFKRLMLKAGSVAVEGFRSILVDVLSEAVKK